MSLHVGLNLLFLVPGYTGGTETYARELIPALVAAAPEIRFTAFVCREAAADRGAPWSELIDCVTVPVDARHRTRWVVGEQLLLPQLARRAGVDLVHSLANTAPGWGAFRRVVTIQDLHHRTVPEAHRGVLALGMRALVTLGVHRTDRVVCCSQETKSQVMRFLRVPESRIDVVPHGLGTTRHAEGREEAALRAELGTGDRPLLLCVAAKRPHKNLMRLLGALARIPATRRPQLILVGYSTPHELKLAQRCANLGIEDDVRLLGWIPEADLEGLYGAANGFVLPSLSEGFGLPVLEAMARGLPVACSDRGALAEVAGGAALLFDPDSEAAIAAAVERLLFDAGESARLRAAGLERARSFTWEAAADGTIASYMRAAADHVAAPGTAR